jgi:hypothetical protein
MRDDLVQAEIGDLRKAFCQSFSGILVVVMASLAQEYLHKSDIRFFFLPVPVTVINLSKRRFNLS